MRQVGDVLPEGLLVLTVVFEDNTALNTSPKSFGESGITYEFMAGLRMLGERCFREDASRARKKPQPKTDLSLAAVRNLALNIQQSTPIEFSSCCLSSHRIVRTVAPRSTRGHVWPRQGRHVLQAWSCRCTHRLNRRALCMETASIRATAVSLSVSYEVVLASSGAAT